MRQSRFGITDRDLGCDGTVPGLSIALFPFSLPDFLHSPLERHQFESCLKADPLLTISGVACARVRATLTGHFHDSIDDLFEDLLVRQRSRRDCTYSCAFYDAANICLALSH